MLDLLSDCFLQRSVCNCNKDIIIIIVIITLLLLLLFEVETLGCPRHIVLDGVKSPHGEGWRKATRFT